MSLNVTDSELLDDGVYKLTLVHVDSFNDVVTLWNDNKAIAVMNGEQATHLVINGLSTTEAYP